jgi:hypothetical protein
LLGQLVEPLRAAPGGGYRDAVGEQFGRCPEVACFGGGLGLGL